MHHSVDIYVGARLRRIRRSMGISQPFLAEQLGLTFQQIQRYEQGINRVSASMLYQAAAVLRVQINVFFDGLPDNVQDRAKAAALEANPEIEQLIDLFERMPHQCRDHLLNLLETMWK